MSAHTSCTYNHALTMTIRDSEILINCLEQPLPSMQEKKQPPTPVVNESY